MKSSAESITPLPIDSLLLCEAAAACLTVVCTASVHVWLPSRRPTHHVAGYQNRKWKSTYRRQKSHQMKEPSHRQSYGSGCHLEFVYHKVAVTIPPSRKWKNGVLVVGVNAKQSCTHRQGWNRLE